MAAQNKLLFDFDATVKMILSGGVPFEARVTGSQRAVSFDVVESTLESEYAYRDGEILALKITRHDAEGSTTTRYVTYGDHKRAPIKDLPSAKLPVAGAQEVVKEPADWIWLGDCNGVQEIHKTMVHVAPEPFGNA